MRRGFTLVEMLVGVAVIAALAMVVFAMVGTARQAATRTASAARMKDWGVAMGLYAGDHHGALPRRGQGVQPVTRLDREEDWFNALPPYLGVPPYGELVLSGRRPRAGEDSVFVRPGEKDPGGHVFLGYGMNMNLSPWNLPRPTRLAQIRKPGVTVFLAESPGPYASTYPSTRAFGCLAPHGGRGNVLFLDGSVRSFSKDYLGVGRGDPERPDVRWLTGTASDRQAGNYR